MNLDWADLIPDIAHEVRTQVRKGLLNAQFLEKITSSPPDGDIQRHLRAIIESQKDLNLLFARLVALADAEASPQLSSKRGGEKVPLETAVLGARLDCRDAILREEAELVVQPLPICDVPSKTQAVLRELFDNSLRYRDPVRPVRIFIEADASEARVRVRVADNGTGIDSAYTAKLFQPLQRFDARGRFGLGLAISRAIVEGAGGKIHSEPAQPGAAFMIDLPIVV
jgi:signal transduction histidine kinase